MLVKSSILIRSVGELCNDCLCSLLERRLKKNVRQRFPFFPNEKVLIVDDGSITAQVMKDLLVKVLGSMPIQRSDWSGRINDVNPERVDSFAKVILPLNGDDIAGEFLAWLMKRDDLVGKSPEMESKSVPFLSCMTGAEVRAYAVARGISGGISGVVSGEVCNPNDLQKGLQELDAKYPGLTHGLLKGMDAFRRSAQDSGSGFK